MDNRLQILTRWVRQFPGFENADPQPVSGDASFRRYFRVSGRPDQQQPAQPFIVMDAPPAHEDCRPFVRIARHWHNQGIAVPRIIQEDLEQGLLLLEDFGDTLMLGALTESTADTLYHAALDELVLIQQATPPPDQPLPPYDAELLDREMALFPDWLLTEKLGLTLDNSERALLDTTFAFLRESALAQPTVTVHRDYHSRNLLVRPGDTLPEIRRPGVIDFQDAVCGPVTYDLVSLLKDCYINWPTARIDQWEERFRRQTLAAGLHNADHDTFHQWFELMGMQRHLKAAGIFARLDIRDGKPGYLGDIPRTVCYLVRASGRQPALRHCHEWLTDRVLPAIEATIGSVETHQP
ncbi:aminoglycoside phosphotransferase family protein [Marinobacter confluentis]|uniref:Aminoglycoside phosphotransferase n=1 Tax=Marinobacter confluentis TaxID=1697557 RepID=A0A4Z1BPS2_9GAMM|nr:phosphotransferase [Marinobacter confluentis]TGN38991.1 aminoglycoside phosphotransferase [Marinobacter confluentis]